MTVTKDQTKKMKNQMFFWTNDETKLLYLRLLINKIPTAWKGYQHWKFLASYEKHHPGLLQAQLFTKCASSSCLHVYDTATLSKYNLFSKTSICRVKFTILGTHTVRCQHYQIFKVHLKQYQLLVHRTLAPVEPVCQFRLHLN